MRLWWLIIVELIAVCFGFSASAEQRFALLIGNKTYGLKVGPLNNPHHDIELVGKSLQQIGFAVVSVKDGTRVKMMRAITDFVDRLKYGGPGAIGFLYYSGHGASNPRNRA